MVGLFDISKISFSDEIHAFLDIYTYQEMQYFKLSSFLYATCYGDIRSYDTYLHKLLTIGEIERRPAISKVS